MAEAPVSLNVETQHVVIGVGDMGVSDSADITLSTYALGSCIGIIAYDPVKLIAGLLHFMLPDSGMSPDRAITQPSMFADTGLENLFRTMNEKEADHGSLRIFLAGGASDLSQEAMFNIGAKNIAAVQNILHSEKLEVAEEDLGGLNNRTIHFEIGTGLLEVKTTTSKQICLK